jgi:glutamate dehydrogenase
MELYDHVLASDVPEDPYIATTLGRYFPKALRERFGGQLSRHPLRREIVSTHVVNSMVNRVGPTFCHRLHEETGAAPADIVRAYLGAREIFELVALWVANEALDHKVGVATQDEIVQATVRLAVRASVWLLHHRDVLRDLAATLARLSPGVAEVGAGLDGWLGAAGARRARRRHGALGRARRTRGAGAACGAARGAVLGARHRRGRGRYP